MTFEVYSPGFNRSRTIARGSARLDSSGNMRLNAADLENLGIEEEAVVLIDRDTRRIALRCVRADDTKGRVAILGANKKPGRDHTTTRIVRIQGALRALGEEPKAFNGTHSTVVKDDMLVIPFGPAPDSAPTQAHGPLTRNALRLEQQTPAAPAKPPAATKPVIDETEPTWGKKARKKA